MMDARKSGKLDSTASTHALEIRRMREEFIDPLSEFFEALTRECADRFFLPHALDAPTARAVGEYRGADLYYAVARGTHVVAYGMLRGWDEGYVTPSLGIALRRSVRGRGFARMFMQFLHQCAAERGARDVRLTVHVDNAPAIRLYEGMGYVLQPYQENTLEGRLHLHVRDRECDSSE